MSRVGVWESDGFELLEDNNVSLKLLADILKVIGSSSMVFEAAAYLLKEDAKGNYVA